MRQSSMGVHRDVGIRHPGVWANVSGTGAQTGAKNGQSAVISAGSRATRTP